MRANVYRKRGSVKFCASRQAKDAGLILHIRNASIHRMDVGRKETSGADKIAYGVLGAAGLIAGASLILHQSPEPWILGRYSLPFLVCLVIACLAMAGAAMVIARFRLRSLLILGVLAAAGVISLAIVEMAGHIYAYLHPSYRTLCLYPNRAVGWTLVPDFEWTWTGHYWYAREFQVPIRTNALGFRTPQRSPDKPPGVRRVVLLGDSLVEALQVPLEQTAAGRLESKLNARAADGQGRYEVLNFGVSNYSTGQCLLVWDEYAAKFRPDEVFLLVAGFHMNRTTTRREYGFLPPDVETDTLWLRPTFRLEAGVPIREPAAHYDSFVVYQNEQIRNELGGRRSIRRSHGLFIRHPLRMFRHYLKVAGWRLMDIQRRYTGVRPANPFEFKPGYFDVDQLTYELNTAVLSELAAKVRGAGAKLVVVDTSDYFQNGRLFAGGNIRPLSEAMREFCASQNIGYLSLSDDLAAAMAKGLSIRWVYDGHFNAAGNEVFADAMFQWINRRSEKDIPKS